MLECYKEDGMSIDYWLGFLSVPVLIIFVICKLVQGAIDEKDRKDMLKKLIEDNDKNK